MKKINYAAICCTFCSFLICLCLFLSVLLGITKFTLLSDSYFSSKLSSSGYSAITAESINQKYRESARPAGIDPEIFNGFITEEEIQDETMNYYRVNYGEQEYSFDATAFNEKLNTVLDKYIADNNIMMDSVSTANVQSYKDACLKVYQEYTSSFMIRYYVMAVNLLEKPVLIGTLTSIILALLSTLIILKSRQSRERQDVYIGTGLIGAGAMLLLPSIFILLSGVINKINIDNESFYNLITSIGNSYLTYLLVFGLISFILGILISFRKNLIHKFGKGKISEEAIVSGDDELKQPVSADELVSASEQYNPTSENEIKSDIKTQDMKEDDLFKEALEAINAESEIDSKTENDMSKDDKAKEDKENQSEKIAEESKVDKALVQSSKSEDKKKSDDVESLKENDSKKDEIPVESSVLNDEANTSSNTSSIPEDSNEKADLKSVSEK